MAEDQNKEKRDKKDSKDNNKSDLEFVIFDMTPMEDYLNHSSKMIYKERLELMNTLIGDKSDIFRLVPKYGTTKDPLVINEVLNKVVYIHLVVKELN